MALRLCCGCVKSAAHAAQAVKESEGSALQWQGHRHADDSGTGVPAANVRLAPLALQPHQQG